MNLLSLRCFWSNAQSFCTRYQPDIIYTIIHVYLVRRLEYLLRFQVPHSARKGPLGELEAGAASLRLLVVGVRFRLPGCDRPGQDWMKFGVEVSVVAETHMHWSFRGLLAAQMIDILFDYDVVHIDPNFVDFQLLHAKNYLV